MARTSKIGAAMNKMLKSGAVPKSSTSGAKSKIGVVLSSQVHAGGGAARAKTSKAAPMSKIGKVLGSKVHAGGRRKK